MGLAVAVAVDRRLLIVPAFAELLGVIAVLASIAAISASVVADAVARQRKEHR